ncbi:helix-turn-helix transcriptional regulator [Streptomyces typhae]|nr:helix-turn-helix transcriptional regulator [Streptomyces typhae]
MVSDRVVSPVFVGRDDALAALAGAWQTAVGAPAVALVAGEAGIGKSRLVTEFEHALDLPVRMVRGACAEFGGEGLAYAPFVAVLRRLVREGAAAAGRYRELARWFPELGEVPEAQPGEQRPLSGKHRLYEEVLALVEEVAAARPVVVAVEDLHWADAASRELFAFLARNLTQPGVLLLATYRLGGAGAGQLGPLLSELARGPRTTTLRLPRLTEGHVGLQLAAILGTAPDAATVHRVHRRSDGNPLFVEALAHGDSHTPDSLRELLLRAPRALPSPARLLLSLVSAGGDFVTHRLLESVADESGPELDALLRPLVDQGLLVTADDGYAFRHALIRQAVYEDLLPGERIRLHTRYAEALRDSDAYAELAAHTYAAGDHERALAFAYRAAHRARRSYAYDEQRRMLERVLDLWDRVRDPSAALGTGPSGTGPLDIGPLDSGPRGADLVGVLTEAAEACMFSGDYRRGIDHATAGLAAVDERRAPERAALLLEHRGRLRHRLGGTGNADFDHALRLLPDDVGNVLRGRVLGVMAMGLLPDADAARWAFDEALRIGRHTGDATVTVRGLLGTGARDGDLGALAEARGLAERLDSHDLLLTVPMYEAMVHTRTGEHRRGVDAALDGFRRARRSGLGLSRGADLACYAAHGLILTGRWDHASALLDEALAEDPPPAARQHLRRLVGRLALCRGDVAAAAAAASGPADALRSTGLLQHYQLVCLLAVAQGDPEEADRVLGRTLADPWFTRVPSSEARSVLVTGALVQEARLDADCNGPTAQQAEDRRTELTLLDAGLPEYGRLDRARRSHLHALLRGGGWQQAVSAWRELGQPYHLAQCLLRAGRSALAAGDLTGGSAQLEEAAELADSLGAAPLSRRIALAAGQAPASHGAPPARPAEGADAPGTAHGTARLTAREHEVLLLIAEGLSNRQIAGRLHISPSTAGVHVSHILAKLGASTRTRAAAIAHRQGWTAAAPPE